MIRTLAASVFLASLAFNAGHALATTPSPDLKVVIIRHGEKPQKGDNLSCQGEQRALKLPAVLYKKLGVPAATYIPSMSMGKHTGQSRMFQTITPFAVKHNLKLNSSYSEANSAAMAQEVEQKTGVVLVVWNHSRIPEVAKNFGISNPPTWPDQDFDSMWVITWPNGKATMSIDKEGINPPDSCDF